jgi:RTX calcium-binding nonapeptide repeat (4 copies)
MMKNLGLSGAVASLVAVAAALGLDAPVSGAAGPTCGGEKATIVGTAGPDKLHGTAGADVIVGRAGADDVDGRGGDDVICGSHGKDHLQGNRGNDRLYGGLGSDRAAGGPGIDFCRAERIDSCQDGAIWSMDETSGTTMADSSGNGNDGTTDNVTMTGKTGYVFDPAVSSKVVVPDSPTLDPGDDTFSYRVDVQSSVAPAPDTDYDLLRKGIRSTAGGEYKLEIVEAKGEGRAFCLVNDSRGSGASVRGTTNVTDGEVHRLTCTKTASGLTLQVDDLAPRTETVPSGLGSISNGSALVIGAKSPTVEGPAGDWYDGALLHARLSIG